MMRFKPTIRIILIGLMAGGCQIVRNPFVGPDETSETEVVHLFNGKNLDGFYTYLKDSGRDADPLGVFKVKDGAIRISGEEWGALITEKEYQNYHLIVEFKWGDETHAPRKDRARDSGILLHSVGEDGARGGLWMYSIECQIIEGGTGDFIVVGDGSDQFAISCPVAPELSNGSHVYQPDGEYVTIHKGRVNWFGRDPAWEDVKDFRGMEDVEIPVGQWNRIECIIYDGTIMNILNGTTVNFARGVTPTKGKIQIQSEGAEIFFRRIDLSPL
ncbi:MAG: DUF1080 domain-containing protein [Gammaproteobacteria bacterium]